ncbi:MAG: hypothetical protein HYY17_00995 [Planctomycetes bacterium]|nr:hypothetical protein [Planctomycetota bacterium]
MATTWTNRKELQVHAIEEIGRLLLKVQAQEIANVEKVLSGQGELLRTRTKEINDKYSAIFETLRIFKEKYARMMSLEDFNTALEGREGKLREERAELERRVREAGEREKGLREETERAKSLQAELDGKLADLDLARRAEELSQKEQALREQEADLALRLDASQKDFADVEKLRDQMIQEAERFTSEKGALMNDLDRRTEALEEQARSLAQREAEYRSRVEGEVVSALQDAIASLVRERLKRPAP